ncbi:MAG: bifunctional 2-C-methyl-D-erythritol 4-phosphate cytidylyltransferase/2-C-methyl-D-erythritol 2,4-cyclodiphosphate synthase [Alphaproteobacteria bacterium]
MVEFSLIIVAAGSGLRFGYDIPKQYVSLGGQTIIRRSINAFSGIDALKSICIVSNPAHNDLLQNSIKGLNNVTICDGGSTRQQSVYNGLIALNLPDDAVVLIHDAARPFVQADDIECLLESMDTYAAATLAAPVIDTLSYADDTACATDHITRENLWALQTPQAFHAKILKDAHEKSDKNKIYTDDTALVTALGYPVKYIKSSRKNFKITQKEDLDLAQHLLHTQTYIGTGFDVHAFDENSLDVKSIRLCGVDVAFDRKLKGHSDADVGLHALTDAILGAVGVGDIGLHFPPSNNDFKNMDSAVFLEHAIKLMRDKGGSLINADVTLICERPKIGEYRDAMVKRMAEIMGTSPARVNIKATTTEKLGFTGRKEGIAAQAAVSVQMPNKDD